MIDEFLTIVKIQIIHLSHSQKIEELYVGDAAPKDYFIPFAHAATLKSSIYRYHHGAEATSVIAHTLQNKNQNLAMIEKLLVTIILLIEKLVVTIIFILCTNVLDNHGK